MVAKDLGLVLLIFTLCHSGKVKAQDAVAEILILPEDIVTVTAGEAVTLTCVVYGSPMPDVSWFRNGDQRIDNFTDNAILYETLIEQSNMSFVHSTLELCPVSLADAGEYSCHTNNTHGNHTSVFQVDVVQVPQIVIRSESTVSVFPGGGITLTCVAHGSPLPDVSWFRDGDQRIDNTTENAVVHERLLEEHFVESELELCPVEMENVGQYSCYASNAQGNHSSIFSVGVTQATNVTIFEFPVDRTADISETVSFVCSASGIPLPDISWYKDGSLLDNVTNNITETFNGTSSITSVLVLDNLVLSSAGEYSCNASNDFSSSDSRTFTLQYGVLIFVSPNNTIATFNTSIVFTCTAIGISSPDITWLKDGTSLSGDFNITEDRLSSDGLHFITLSVLTLCDLESSDSGQYSCVASNNISTGQVTDSRDFTLEVQVPPTVTPTEEELIGVEHRDNTSSDITVSFTITRAFPAVEAQNIAWSYTLTRGPMNSTEMDVLTLAMNSSKYNLSADRRSLIIYDVDFFDAGYFTVNATNEAGTGTATQELIVHVEPELLDTSYGTNETVENDTVSFSCVADGYPLPNIIWLHNNSFIPVAVSPRHAVSVSTVASSNRPHIPEATNSTLTVSRLRLRDTGEYLCRVDPSNRDRGRSDISGPFEMTVSPAPINYCQPDPCQNGGVCSNQTASYLCTCDPTKWRGVNCTIEVFEFEPPTITEQPDLDSFPELSRRVTLTCGVFGIPEPNITWFKDGVVLEGERSNNLIIVEVELVDRGRYKCTAENFDPHEDRSNTFSDESSEAVVNIKGIAQYDMTVQFEQRSRVRRQNMDQDLELSLDEFSQSLSGVELNDDATVLSVTTEETTAEEDATQASLLITLLAPEGGSQELTEELDKLVSETAQEVGLVISEPPMRFDGCVAERTVLPPLEEGGLEVVLMWPESDLGETVVLQCPCGNLSTLTNNTIDRNASRTCGGSFSEGAVWESPLDMPCNFSSATRRLCLVANLIEEPEEALGELDNITSNEEDIGVDELGVTTILLEAISVGAEQDAMLTEDLFGVVDNLLGVDVMDLQMSQEEANTSARILNLVESVAQSVPIPENETSLVFRQESFAVAVMDLNPDPNAFEGQDFSINIGDSGTIGEDAISLEGSQQATASLSIPNNTLLRTIMIPSGGVNMSARIPRITNAAYLNDALFVRREERNDSEVGSIIVAASLSLFSEEGVEDVRVTDLDPPIRLVFVKLPAFENGSNVSCNFWDFAADGGFGDWSSENCEIAEENDTIIVCECTHFTNFAILLDPNPVEVDIPPVVGQFLSAVSFIGAGISIICLILTVLTYISSKKLRTSEAGQLLMHLSFGLLGIYVMFIICFLMADDKVPDALCAIAGGLLHYFLLVTFFLMAAEAINLYTKLVIVLGVPSVIKNRYVLKAGLISWIVPLFIVIVSEAPDWTNYIGEEFCRPYGPPFYGGLVAPFGIIYILNWVLFFVIFISLCRRSSAKTEVLSEQPSTWSKIKQQFIVAVMLSLLFGLGWGVGLVATTSIPVLEVSLTLQIIFIILTNFQGVLILVMNCLRSADARAEWLLWIKIATCGKLDYTPRKQPPTSFPQNKYSKENKFALSSSSAAKPSKDTTVLTGETALSASASESVDEKKEKDLAYETALSGSISEEDEEKKDLTIDS